MKVVYECTCFICSGSDHHASETFELFTCDLPSTDLGMVNEKSSTVQVEVAGQQYEIRQSPGLLTSSRAEGTTGAALWRTSPLVAEWLADKSNSLWSNGLLHTGATIVELGCGIAGLVGCVLARHVSCYVLTDQEYLMKILKENVQANAILPAHLKVKGRNIMGPASVPTTSVSSVKTLALNWEDVDVSALDEVLFHEQAIDMVIACDCIFNDYLLEPFVDVCEKISERNVASKPIILIAQQLRSDEVFSTFMGLLNHRFNIWRLSDLCLPSTLQSGSGFAIHIAILR